MLWDGEGLSGDSQRHGGGGAPGKGCLHDANTGTGHWYCPTGKSSAQEQTLSGFCVGQLGLSVLLTSKLCSETARGDSPHAPILSRDPRA